MTDDSTTAVNAPEDIDHRGTGGWERILAVERHLVAPGGEWRSELWATAVEQFTRAADLLDIDPQVRTRLLEPRRALTVNFPIRRDDGRVEILTGYRGGAHRLVRSRARVVVVGGEHV